ncbi:MAG: hypothetical protein HOE90_23530 [Bacteriovoracaceae bacterium]|jgi:hypothetical protein|nr:hypothetical protein [Bacteriovoracaceae bacterium]
MEELKEGEDFEFNENGEMVFSGSYLKKRGYCCQSGCQNCPWEYAKKVDPNVPAEFNDPWGRVDSVDSCLYGCDSD